MQSWELIARGRVQGVGFRWHVQRCARRYGVLGYVQNLSDGTVFIIAQAEEQAFEGFDCSVSSEAGRAIVSGLEIKQIDYAKSYNDFEIR